MESLDVFLLALLSFLMGAVLVGVVVYLRGGASKRAAEGGAPDPSLEEVARLWRNRNTRRVVVQLDEKYFTAASELNSDQQQHLMEATTGLQTWLATEPRGAAAHPASPDEPHPAPPLTAPSNQEGTRPTPASQQQGVKPVAARPLEALSRVFNSGSAKEAAGFKSIAAQINDIMQSRLPGSPFEAQGVTLVEMPDQAVIVRVGSVEFAGIEAVPDPAVRAFIKAAVAEWEASTRAGIK